MHARPPRGAAGFTLVELSVGFAIVGVVGAVIVPLVARRAALARTSEATSRLAQLYRGSLTYWSATADGRIGASTRGVFPDALPLTPSLVPVGTRVVDPVGTWSSPGWRSLGFNLVGPHAYAYAYDSSPGAQPAFTARALGDLDGDGDLATFERAARANDTGDVVESQGLWMNGEVE